MSNEIGISLNSYQGLEFFQGSSPQELKAQLDQIKVPFHIIAIYAVGSSHYAWINSGSMKVKKVETKKSKEK